MLGESPTPKAADRKMPEHARPCGTRPSRPPPAGDALSGCAPPAPRPLQARGQGRGVFPLERGVDDLLTMLSSFTHNSERGPGGAPEGARAADRKVEGRPNERIVFGRLQGEAGALRAFGARQPSEGIRQRFRGKLRVEPPPRLAEARLPPGACHPSRGFQARRARRLRRPIRRSGSRRGLPAYRKAANTCPRFLEDEDTALLKRLLERSQVRSICHEAMSRIGAGSHFTSCVDTVGPVRLQASSSITVVRCVGDRGRSFRAKRLPNRTSCVDMQSCRWSLVRRSRSISPRRLMSSKLWRGSSRIAVSRGGRATPRLSDRNTHTARAFIWELERTSPGESDSTSDSGSLTTVAS